MDRASPPKAATNLFLRARKVEQTYARRLRKVARHIGDIISEIWDGTTASSERISDLLNRYATTITPWAESVGARMVAEVNARDHRAWMDASRRIGLGVRDQLDRSDVGLVVRRRMADQVGLITSLPREAAERVHKLTLEGISESRRAADIAKEIMRSGEVTASRAMLIARTEVGRTSTELSRARAQSVGSTYFIWRTVGDSDVRPSHRALNGRTFRWDDPPECDPGHHALPGAIWNCRCWPEPIIDD